MKIEAGEGRPKIPLGGKLDADVYLRMVSEDENNKTQDIVMQSNRETSLGRARRARPSGLDSDPVDKVVSPTVEFTPEI